MSLWRELRRGLWSLTHRRDADREVVDEVAHYLEETVAWYVADGMSEKEALRAARLTLGGEDNVREQVRGYGWENAVGAFAADLRYAVRQLLRTPVFTLACAFSMGMGIAVSVVAYTLLNSLLFKPLPVPDHGDIVHVFATLRGDSFGTSSYPAFEDYRKQKALAGMVAFSSGYGTIITNNRDPELTGFQYVTPDYFDVLRVPLRAGRAFSAAGDVPEIVLTDSYSRRMFDAGERILGATISINRIPFTIVGVAPRGFHGLDDNEGIGWVPVAAAALVGTTYGPVNDLSDPANRRWHVAGRLAAGATTASAAARLQPIASEYARLHREWRDINVPLEVKVFTHDQKKRIEVQEYLGEALIAMGAIVAVVLILACTNVAGLLLARSVTRGHEVAVRLTLGATRTRLAMQFMVESVVVALLGGVAGWVLAHWLVMLATRTPLMSGIEFEPDWRVLAATLATCLICAMLFGSTPIAHALRINVKAGLSGTGVVGAQGGVRARLLALQVCLACLLIVLGLHASRGVIARMQSRATFDVDGIIVAELQSWGVREIRDSVDRKEYVENAERILRALPGVQMTSPTPSLEPVEGIAGRRAMILLPGSAQKRVQLQKVRLDYFRTLGVGMRQGQLPRTVPTLQGRRTAVVNRAFIDSVGRNVVGSTVHVVDYGDVFVVAEVNGINAASGGQGWPAMYELASEGDFGLGSGYLIARVQKGSEKAVVAAYARAMRSQYPRMVPPSTGSLKSRIDVYTAPQRYVARAALMFGGAELILAAIGLYSILLYQVLTRTREIGVRMALGAAPSRASYAVLQEAFSSVGIGLVLGMIVSIPGSIIAARNFPGAELRDIVPVTVAVISILAAAAAACIVPARRAARVQPMDALRHE